MWENFFDQVKLADDLGFETAWVAETHLSCEEQKKNANAVIPHFKGGDWSQYRYSPVGPQGLCGDSKYSYGFSHYEYSGQWGADRPCRGHPNLPLSPWFQPQ